MDILFNSVIHKAKKYLYNIFANTLFVGKKNFYLPSCQSTNTIAVEYINSQNIIEGTSIITSQQTSGRGQRGNTWISEPDKNITTSIILQPKFLAIQNQFWLNIIASLAVYNVLSEFVTDGIKIKWPNDIYYLDKKIGGILIENLLSRQTINHSIIGIGLNINQTNFPDLKATSLCNIKNVSFKLENIFELLFQHLEKRYLQLKGNKLSTLKTEYLNNLYWYQEEHLFENLISKSENEYFKGQILGIDSVGRLAIGTKEKILYFNFKEVRYCE